MAWCGALALAAGAGCSPAPETKEAAKPEPRRAAVARVEALEVEQTVYATGSLAAQDRTVLSAKVPGRLESITADLGARVKKGDLLARIEKQDFELKRRQAEAALAQARARLGIALTGEEDQVEIEATSIVREAKALLGEAEKNRNRILRLREQGILPDAEVETAEAQFQVAVNRHEEAGHEARNRAATLKLRQAELDIAAQELMDTEFRAPFDGTVELRQASPGEFLSVGVPLLTLVRIDPIRLRLEISEVDAPKVRLGQRILLRIEGQTEGGQAAGNIGRLSPVITADNRMLVAEADLPNADGMLRPGSFAKADIVIDEKARGLFVPKSAVLIFAGMQKIFLVENGMAAEREVSLGRTRGGKIEVRGRVKAGDTVVAEPAGLRHGQAVEPLVEPTAGGS